MNIKIEFTEEEMQLISISLWHGSIHIEDDLISQKMDLLKKNIDLYIYFNSRNKIDGDYK